MDKKFLFTTTISKKGSYCLWEQGGGRSNTGAVTVIANPVGEKPTAIYIREHGTLACDKHALIPVSLGYYIIKVSRFREEFKCDIFQIVGFCGDVVVTVRVLDTPNFLSQAVETAEQKVLDYHCRSPYFVKTL